MATTQNIQVLQDGHLGVEPSLNAVLGARLLVPVELAGGNGLATDALAEADIVQLVNSYSRCVSRQDFTIKILLPTFP